MAKKNKAKIQVKNKVSEFINTKTFSFAQATPSLKKTKLLSQQ